jgi:hypothetical protein
MLWLRTLLTCTLKRKKNVMNHHAMLPLRVPKFEKLDGFSQHSHERYTIWDHILEHNMVPMWTGIWIGKLHGQLVSGQTFEPVVS